jgi:hypothetical protein
MADEWPSNIKRVCELKSEHGPPYASTDSFDTVINAFIERGWKVLASYIHGRISGQVNDECCCLMGWTHDGKPDYPKGYANDAGYPEDEPEDESE